MNKTILSLLAATVALSSGFANEQKPKVSLCQAEVCNVIDEQVKQVIAASRERVAQLSHEDKIVMNRFDQLADLLNCAFYKEKSMTAAEVEEICLGIDFAAEKHRLQTRKNKEKTPYISHPLGVAYNLMEIGDVRESSVIIAALLHDTVEDTQTTFEEIETRFGNQVMGLVKELTDDKSLAKEARKRLQVINAAHKSKGAAQIKLADKLYNLNDLSSNPPSDWTQTRIDHYFEWAQSVVDRLPQSNEKLEDAVDDLINDYWEKQE